MAAHGHSHSHAHSHAADAAGGSRRALTWAAALTLILAAIEAAGGAWTGSLALLSDAGHMVTDAASLALGALAAWMAQRPVSTRHSYGYGRAEVLAAVVNATAMLAIAVAIAWEAYGRLRAPAPVHGAVAALIALAGLVVNVIILRRLAPHRHDLNARAALLHVVGDLLGSVAAIVAGTVIALTGWTPIDPLASLAICALILVSSVRLLREGVHALMEGVPHGVTVEAVGREMARAEGVVSVHDLHVWTLSGSRTALSAHVVVRNLGEWDRVLRELQSLLQERFGIDHVTVQPEPEARPLVRH